MAMKRGSRYPRISSALSIEPYSMYPIAVHPVLPGETVQNMYLDGRVHLNGAKSTLSGWFLDVMCCYVKIRDIEPDLVEMFINPDYAFPTEYVPTATNRDVGVASTQAVDWVSAATNQVYQTYIAREREYYHGGLPLVPNKWPGSFQSFYELTDDANSDLEGESSIIQDMIEDVDNYADVLSRYGIREAAIRRMLPEILLWRSYHNYPVLAAIDDNSEILNRNQVLWTIREARATQKGVFITEPGFIMAWAWYRPDTFEWRKKGWMANEFSDAIDWFVPPYELADGIGTLDKDFLDGIGYASNLHYSKFDTWMNGETYTNIDPGDVAVETQLKAHSLEMPQLSVGFGQRFDYPRTGSITDFQTNIAPHLLASDYYCGISSQLQMSIRTPLVI